MAAWGNVFATHKWHMPCNVSAIMNVAILIYLLGIKAYAGCELQAKIGDKVAKAPVVMKHVNLNGVHYEAKAGGFFVTIDFMREEKIVNSRVTAPNGQAFELKATGTDFIEELDCFGGSIGDASFRLKCDSREWRAMKHRNGWEGKWCVE